MARLGGREGSNPRDGCGDLSDRRRTQSHGRSSYLRAGYRAHRNSYKPWAAPTIAEFYNRNYYYFKEVLADFFFYPAYLRYFKARPELRLFFATFAAAGCGNFVFHMLFSLEDAGAHGLGSWLAKLQVYAFYSAVLGIAIGWSQVRTRRRGSTPRSRGRKIAACAAVLFFYALIMNFDVVDGVRGLPVYLRFVIFLFNPFAGSLNG